MQAMADAYTHTQCTQFFLSLHMHSYIPKCNKLKFLTLWVRFANVVLSTGSAVVSAWPSWLVHCCSNPEVAASCGVFSSFFTLCLCNINGTNLCLGPQ